jgi:arginine N-succinyltransferase
MHVIRPVKREDESAILHMIGDFAFGISTLPHNRRKLRDKIKFSITSFEPEVSKPKDERYFFVLEDLNTAEIVGCCAIYSKTGIDAPDDYFEIAKVVNEDPLPEQPHDLQILKHKSYRNGPSMLCSLYLAPAARKMHLGHLLSFSRLLFIASFPKRFTDIIIASIRGQIDENETSPFWNDVCHNFFEVDFITLNQMIERDKSFIEKIIPKYPIYVCLLSQKAQNCIRQPHKNSAPALKMLVEQGFVITNEIDPFDGGPKISGVVSQLEIVKNHRSGTIVEISDFPHENLEEYMIANGKLDYRACYGALKFSHNGDITIEPKQAIALKVSIGDTIFYHIDEKKKSNVRT